MLTEVRCIADRYEIVGKAGAGGMSDVYKAKDLILGRYVAIKILKPEFSEDMNFVTKFRTEAQSAAGLEHPNIVNIYDVGSENGIHYIVMEYVEGITLKTYIEKKVQLSFKEAVSIAIQVGRGIEAAHSKNIVHRDIKPQNIMISTEGKVKVTDFGIARAATSNTISSDVMGSVHYSSPEQARNGFVDGKSDIYSLGIVMYEMVTGRVPFDGDTTVAVAIQHLQDEMVLPSVYAPNLPISMEKIIIKCTQKNPDRRYESISALLSDLRKALISPDEDFVVMVPLESQDKTRIIGGKDLQQIQKEAGNVHLKKEEAEMYRKQESVRTPEPEDDEDEEDDEDDGDINPKIEKAITVLGIAAAVVIVIIIAYILYGLFGGFSSGGKNHGNDKKNESQVESNIGDVDDADKDADKADGSDAENDKTDDADKQEKPDEKPEEEKVSVPSLAGKTIAEARQALSGSSLGIKEMGSEASDTVEKGKIISQKPQMGESVEKNTTVEVIVSSGKGSVDIPHVIGISESDAVSTLSNAGFSPDKTYSYSNDVAKGYVISQNPVDTQGKEGDVVTIEISQGRETVTVPDVTTTYKSEEQATLILQELFVVSTEKIYSDMPAGIVIGQSLDAGKQAEKGAAITITVSLGPEPAEVVKPTTYKMNISLQLPPDASNISGANIVLYDNEGNVLQKWKKKSVEEFGTDGLVLTKTGILVERGQLVVTWLDLDGNELKEQPFDMEFKQES